MSIVCPRAYARALGTIAMLLVCTCSSPVPRDRATVTGQAGSLVESEGADGVLKVHVVNYPLKYLAERIGGEHVLVRFPAPPDLDPASWRPAADTIVAYQQADLILLNGAGYARWTLFASLPESKLVNTSAGFEDRYLRVKETVTHTHGPEGDHSHDEIAFTTWLDPQLAIMQAGAIRDAFTKARPENREDFQRRFEALEMELLELDQSLEVGFLPARNKPLLASHPIYQYLARRYDLDLESVHFEPGEDPGEKGWGDLQRILVSHPATWMLWEARPLDTTAQKLADLGVRIIVFDPCGNGPEEGDFLSVMRSNLKRLQVALREAVR